MSIPNIQGPNTQQAFASPAPTAAGSAMPSVAASQNLQFDRLQQQRTQPNIRVKHWQKAALAIRHPISLLYLWKQRDKASGEGLFSTLKMYHAVHAGMDRKTNQQLNALLKGGALTRTDTDDQHSTLYYLYAMLSTQRGRGYDNKTLVQETIETLHRPYLITQKFAPLSENNARAILSVRNAPGLNRAGAAPPPKPIGWADLNVDASATCVSSSLMYYMADKKPGELARHINELTSPMNAFFEKVKLSELSPDDPSQAYEILKQQNIQYFVSGPDEVTVKVEVPPAGTIRAIDAQKVKGNEDARNAIETVYQSALTYLATRSYDPATDMRDADSPGETSKGLTEPEKTLMETIIKDNGGVQSVTYQYVAPKTNPQPGEEGNSYLYSYTRSFEQTASDILKALQLNEPVIIGITDTDESGAIVGGHEITIMGAFVDKKDGELKFSVADSDDGIPAPVVRSARELIPRIHHAGLPLQLARQINTEIQQAPQHFLPDQATLNRFTPMPRATDPEPPADPNNPAQAAPTPEAAPVAANSAMNPATGLPQATSNPVAPQGQQVIDWVPVSYLPTAPPAMPAPPTTNYSPIAATGGPNPFISQVVNPASALSNQPVPPQQAI